MYISYSSLHYISRTVSGKAGSISWIGLSSRARLVLTYSEQDTLLCSYSLNGRLLGRVLTGERIHAFCISEDGKVTYTTILLS